MAYELQTFSIIADFAKSHFVDFTNSQVDPPAGYVSKIPNLWAENSFQLMVYCYENYDNSEKSNFGDAASATLYIKYADSVSQPIELATGTITADGDDYHIVTFDVDAEDLLYSLAGSECILYGVITDTDRERTFAQRIQVIDEQGSLSFDARWGTRDISISIVEVDETPYTGTAYPGTVYYVVDTDVEEMTVNLPPITTYTTQHVIIYADGANDVVVSDTDTTIEAGDTAQFFLAGGEWTHLVFDWLNG